MKLAFANGVKNLRMQTQVTHVAGWQNDPLLTGQTATLTNFEETFDFLINATNRLHVPKLIDRASYRNLLVNRLHRERTDQCAKFSKGGAVAIHFSVRLLKHNRGGEGQWLVEDRKSTRLNSSHL